MNENYYSVEDIAAKLGVHTKTIRRYIFSGKISANKIGGKWRISEDSYNDFIGNCENSGTCTSDSCSSDNVSQDDFCVFMDSDQFSSDANIQICTIVDCFVESKPEVTPISTKLMSVLNSYDKNDGGNKFNYIYDSIEKKARFVIWGTPTFISLMVEALKEFE